ncbi:hypothetical protein AAHC03_013179 [Spirometra sp. Aus1]
MAVFSDERICGQLDVSFAEPTALNTNVEDCVKRLPATNNLQCNHCDRLFASQAQIDRHLQYVTFYRQFECPFEDCDRTFATKSHLSAHLAVHNGSRPFACDFAGCTYRSRTTSQLAQHKATHGLGYVYACDFCDYQATTSSNLRRHSRLHLNTRPYLCPHCPHTFVELSALRRHVLDSAHHPGLPLYVCPWCSSATSPAAEIVGFNSSALAWRHVQQQHAEELAHPETMRRLGRKPGEVLIEHDVSLIFGLYHPNQDAKFPPSASVRQPSSSGPLRRPRGRQRLLQGTATLTSSSTLPPEPCRPDHESLERLRSPLSVVRAFDGRDFATVSRRIEVQMHQSPPHTPSQNSSLSDVPVSSPTRTTSLPSLQFAQANGLVALPGGVIWSAATFEAELSAASCSPPTHVLT